MLEGVCDCFNQVARDCFEKERELEWLESSWVREVWGGGENIKSISSQTGYDPGLLNPSFFEATFSRVGECIQNNTDNHIAARSANQGDGGNSRRAVDRDGNLAKTNAPRSGTWWNPQLFWQRGRRASYHHRYYRWLLRWQGAPGRIIHSTGHNEKGKTSIQWNNTSTKNRELFF